MSRKANGLGSIRKISKTVDGKTYTYWQARYTVGTDPATGKQIQKSVNGKTQKEVVEKLKTSIADVDEGFISRKEPMKMKDWLMTWYECYIPDVKPQTRSSYLTNIKQHWIPAIGECRIDKLSAETIQNLYKRLFESGKSPKTIRNIHVPLNSALNKAVKLGYIRKNPAKACTLPKIKKHKFEPFDEEDIVKFIKAVKGHKFEELYLLTLFTGMREGEVIGLTWDCVDFDNRILTIDKQLQFIRETHTYEIVPTKNSKDRYIAMAPFVCDILKQRKAKQEYEKQMASSAWKKSNLVFTNELGGHLSPRTVYNNFKTIVAKIGRPDFRFHDLRHTYAVASLLSGDDVKTLQENLGHYTAAFTLDAYGHVIDKMRKASANNMQRYIDSLPVSF